MKKAFRPISLLLFIVLAFSLAACGGTTPATNAPVQVMEFQMHTGQAASLVGSVTVFVEAIEEVSGGAMKINYLPNSDYRDKTALDELMSNNVDFTYASASPASATITEVGYIGMPGCYRYAGEEDTETFLSFAAAIDDALNSILADYNTKYLALRPPNEMAIATVKKPVHSAEDLEGMITRTSGTWLGQLMLLMNVPTANIATNEMATALQRSTVDAVLTGTEQLVNNQVYEVSEYISIISEVDGIGLLLCCQTTWDSLTDQQKAWVEEASTLYMERNLQIKTQAFKDNLKKFEDAGIEVYSFTDEECDEFLTHVPAVYEQIDAESSAKGPVLKDAVIAWRAANLG